MSILELYLNNRRFFVSSGNTMKATIYNMSYKRCDLEVSRGTGKTFE